MSHWTNYTDGTPRVIIRPSFELTAEKLSAVLAFVEEDEGLDLSTVAPDEIRDLVWYALKDHGTGCTVVIEPADRHLALVKRAYGLVPS